MWKIAALQRDHKDRVSVYFQDPDAGREDLGPDLVRVVAQKMIAFCKKLPGSDNLLRFCDDYQYA
jgi:hypothetical protein